MKNHHLLTGTNPPQFLSAEELVARARRVEYQPCRLAKDLGLNRKTFQRRFNRAFGAPPGRWLKDQRIQDAKALLERGLSTKEVAVELGYRDRSSLFRAFRLQLRDTPKHFLLVCMTVASDDRRMASETLVSRSATFLSRSATPPRLQLGARA